MKAAGDHLSTELDRVIVAYEQLVQQYNALIGGGAVPHPAFQPPAASGGRRGLLGVVALAVLFVGGWWYFSMPSLPPEPVPWRLRPMQPLAPLQPEAQRLVVSSPSLDGEGLLNVREGAGVKYAVLARLKHGQTVTLLGEAQAVGTTLWVKVHYGSGIGWVNKAFLVPGE